MRIYQEGFELDDSFVVNDSSTNILPIARWVTSDFSTPFVTEDAGRVHKNPNGDGGLKAIGLNTFSLDRRYVFGSTLPYNMRYGWTGFAMTAPNAGSELMTFGFSVINGGSSTTAKQIDISIDTGGFVYLSVAGTVIEQTLSPLPAGYHWYAVEYYVHDTNGFVNVYIDDVLSISTGTVDTRGDATFDFWNQYQAGLGRNSSLDDIILNAATISYNVGSGTPTIGAVVSGGTSGSVAIITDYVEASAGIGFLILEPQSTTAPSGYLFGEPLSDGFGWTATANQEEIDANGLDKNSGKPSETFLLLLRPTADVSAGLTGQDGNSVDNWQNVDDDPFGDTATYNTGTTTGQEDIYTVENLPFSPGSIDAVEVISYSSRAGSIPGIEHGVNPGVSTTYGTPKLTGSGGSFAKGSEIFDVNPDTGNSWTEGQVNATDVGVKLG